MFCGMRMYNLHEYSTGLANIFDHHGLTARQGANP